jgi:hypothetical protein
VQQNDFADLLSPLPVSAFSCGFPGGSFLTHKRALLVAGFELRST